MRWKKHKKNKFQKPFINNKHKYTTEYCALNYMQTVNILNTVNSMKPLKYNAASQI
jgi:hypothetical protein